jgi:thiamine biosynthesis protein ThiI
MERLLAENVRAILDDRGIEGRVERRWSRLLIHVADAETAATAAAATADAPGVVWARPATARAPELDAIEDALGRVASSHGSGTFAVRARRTGPDDAHPFTSTDLERAGGATVQAATGAAVDLDDPDRTYRIECREDEAFVSVEEYAGPGGLPLGTQGVAVALVSGGIDSPVAAWEMMRRGCEIVPLYVDPGPYGGADHEARAVGTVRPLARRAPDRDMRLRVVPGGEIAETLVADVGDTRMLSWRRAMLRMAERLAHEVGAHSIVTGESLGQKSSQTGANLAATDAAVSTPVHRPLVCHDKADVVERARGLGTFEDATIPAGCERIAPLHPETNASLGAVEAAESDDLLERAEAAVADCRVVEVRGARR